MNESTVAQAQRGWAQHQRTRYQIAAWLAIPGALVWTIQALGAWIQSQEGKWQDKEYLSIGDSTIAADDLLTFLSYAFLLIGLLLGYGAVLLLRGKTSGRRPLLVGAWLVILGQLGAGVLAAIPIDAFHHSAPPNLVFSTLLVIFPVLTILCLTG
ncbi:hypothetical protein [Nocardia sp. NPDC051832]|uniref:hypothetical protein n=1 Tax=Nocardia sp. NPDC051832 TaxID=3155673 RepID=UPI0034215A33